MFKMNCSIYESKEETDKIPDKLKTKNIYAFLQSSIHISRDKDPLFRACHVSNKSLFNKKHYQIQEVLTTCDVELAEYCRVQYETAIGKLLINSQTATAVNCVPFDSIVLHDACVHVTMLSRHIDNSQTGIELFSNETKNKNAIRLLITSKPHQ